MPSGGTCCRQCAVSLQSREGGHRLTQGQSLPKWTPQAPPRGPSAMCVACLHRGASCHRGEGWDQHRTRAWPPLAGTEVAGVASCTAPPRIATGVEGTVQRLCRSRDRKGGPRGGRGGDLPRLTPSWGPASTRLTLKKGLRIWAKKGESQRQCLAWGDCWGQDHTT